MGFSAVSYTSHTQSS